MSTLLVFSLALSLLKGSNLPSPGERFYSKNQFLNSEQYYKKVLEKKEDPRIHYNLGTAQYKAGKFKDAKDSFMKSLPQAELKLQEDIFYNLGNTNYQLGNAIKAKDKDKTKALWEESIQNFESVLELNADHAQAKNNKEFVEKEIEKLDKETENQQEKQNQESPKDQEQQKESKNKDQQKDPNQQEKAPPNESKSDSQDKNDQNQKKEEINPKDLDKHEQPQYQNDKPQEQEGLPEPQAKNDAPSNQTDSAPSISRLEAEQLLDSLNEGDKPLPALPLKREKSASRNW